MKAKEVKSMWAKLGVFATIGSILCGILGAICDAKDVKDRISAIKK